MLFNKIPFGRILNFAMLLLAVSWLGCSMDAGGGLSMDIGINDDKDHEGMMFVAATGRSVVLGTDLESVKSNERPSMDVILNYDFSIGKHEVTCGEYHDLIFSVPCSNDSLPKTDVTFYEAVLYANARSKAENYDTVYTYTKVSYDADGMCIGMEGYAFHPEVEGYRLPTEAEWILVASAGWNPKNGWTADNSGNTTHPVCGKRSLLYDVCDMAGNAMEWVNDWAGTFRDTTVTNYVGAPDGGSLGERVLKGGSYINEASAINLYGRGDVYTVASATHAAYVGFRLAFGPIPDALWLGRNGAAVTSPVTPLTNAATMRSIFGTNKSKLVFRNAEDGRLSYIDYSSISLSVNEIDDTLDVYHPDVSPDGKRVAFCTGVEGITGSSSVYVRNIDSVGSGLVKLNVENAAIPRWKVLDSGDTVIVYVTDAGNNSSESDFLGKETWEVPFAGGEFGTPQKLFDGNYHGGISEDDRLAVTGARLLRARIALPKRTLETNAQDTVWYNGEQACNASLATDGSKRTLFLDFGGETGAAFAGVSYGVHERLLVADSTGALIQTMAAPENYSFDHTEWVHGSSDLVVATLSNINGAHKKIVLLNLSDSTITELVDSEELWHPVLWVSPLWKQNTEPVDSSVWTNDSVGVYYAEGQSQNGLLSQKMPMFWKYKDSIELVGLGSSRVWSGFYGDSLSVRSINMGTTPCDMHCIYFLERNYVINQYRHLKYLVISIDPDLWSESYEMADINLNIEGGIGYIYDASHNNWEEGVSDEFVQKVLDEAPEDAAQWEKTMGWYATSFSQGWYDDVTGKAEVIGDSTWSDDTTLVESNFQKLRMVIELANNYNVNVLGIVFPQSPGYKKTGSFGRHGMRRSQAEKLIQRVQNLELEYKNFLFMDENNMGDHIYADYMALDFDHLNYSGALYLADQIEYKLKWFE